MSLVVSGTLFGCAGCMVALESLTRSNSNAMHMMTFITFVVITLEGLLRKPHYLVDRKIPLRAYATIVLLFFVVNVANNESIAFEVPFPLFIIFRSGTLFANVILTAVLQRRTYSPMKIASVAAVTIGIACFVWNSETPQIHSQSQASSWMSLLPLPKVATGVILMTMCLFLSAYMGLLQEELYRDYGKHPEEMMFYVHFVSLPLFALVLRPIWTTAVDFSHSQPLSIFGISTAIPSLWAKMSVTCLLQLVCIRSVYRLTSIASSLNVTMILTIRKFLNLLLSVVIFKNPFTVSQVFATALVFLGTFAFYDGPQQLYTRLRHYNMKKTS